MSFYVIEVTYKVLSSYISESCIGKSFERKKKKYHINVMSLDTQGKSDSNTDIEVDVSYNTANKTHNLSHKATYQADT